MPLNLPALLKARGIRRKAITLRPIIPTTAQATDLAAIYAPAWRTWSEAINAIMAGYDPAPLPTGDTLTVDSPSSIQTAIDQAAALFLTRLVTEIGPGLRRWAVRVERWHRDRFAAGVKAGTGIDLDMILTAQPVEETLSVWLARNTALVRNVSDQAQSRISDAVFRGYQNRTPAREVAKEIREAVGMGRDRSVRIAADQLSKLSAALDTERQAEAGIEFFKWRHSGKAHPRSWHKARDGKVYELRSGKERGGSAVIPADDRPGMQPFCGCRAQAYIALMDEV